MNPAHPESDLASLNAILIRLDPERWRNPRLGPLEKTRKWWRVGARRLKADWAFAVVEGTVRAVFRIEDWEEPTTRDLEGKPHRIGRWAFRGTRDPEMEAKYVGCDVRDYLGSQGAQNPIKYINC